MRPLHLLLAAAVGGAVLVAPRAAAGDADSGRVWRGDGTLHGGCHAYRFRYRVRPGHRDWQLELFLRGPGREGLGTVVRDSDFDPRRGRSHVEVCRSATRPGTFRIRGKLSVREPEGPPFETFPEEPDVTWLEPAWFRLLRAR